MSLLDQEKVMPMLDQDEVMSLLDQEKVMPMLDQDEVMSLLDQDEMMSLLDQEDVMSLLDQEETMSQLECFRCDLGFWDACFTTKTNCSAGERCYTGRGKAADVLDVKTLGCVRAEECEVVTRVEIFPNTTVYTMTRSCCNTDLCNTAPVVLPTSRLLLAMATLSAILLAAPSISLQ